MSIEEKAMRVRHLLVDAKMTVLELSRAIRVQQADMSRAINYEKADDRLEQAIDFLESHLRAKEGKSGKKQAKADDRGEGS